MNWTAIPGESFCHVYNGVVTADWNLQPLSQKCPKHCQLPERERKNQL